MRGIQIQRDAAEGNAGACGRIRARHAGIQNCAGMERNNVRRERRRETAESSARLSEVYLGFSASRDWDDFDRTRTRRDDCASGDAAGAVAVKKEKTFNAEVAQNTEFAEKSGNKEEQRKAAGPKPASTKRHHAQLRASPEQ